MTEKTLFTTFRVGVAPDNAQYAGFALKHMHNTVKAGAAK